jgi:methylmalonyl-CoA mutase N-terminal domain/subunit
VVGVNRFQAREEHPIPTLHIDPQIERSQVARVKALRARRDGEKARAALDEIERRARGTDNLMPAILAAVESYATVGEISDALRHQFGEYHESVVI